MTSPEFPLTPQQEGMLFHTLLAPGTGVDVLQIRLELAEELDLAAFERAWCSVIRRHEALRTGFRWEGLAEPVQFAAQDVAFRLRHVEPGEGDIGSCEARWLELEGEERSAGFDLTRPPLLRVVAMCLAPRKWRVLWTIFHGVHDGGSIVIVLREVFEHYDAQRAGRQVSLPPAPTYAEHVAWLAGRDAASDESYWRARLDGFSGAMRFDLPPPRAAIAPGEPRHAQPMRELSEGETTALFDYARANDLPMTVLIQAAWAILMSRTSGRRHVSMGAVRACRRNSSPHAERTVGLLVNTLPVLVDTDPSRRIADWLTELRQDWHGLREVEHTPLARIAAWSGRTRREPMFETLVCYDSQTFGAAVLGGNADQSQRRVHIIDQSNYPLALHVYGGERMQLWLGYDRSEYAAPEVKEALGCLALLLAALPARSDGTIADLPWLTGGHRTELIALGRGPRSAYPRDASLQGLFELQVSRDPSAVAVEDAGRCLTYAELDDRARRLAVTLQAKGVVPGDRVLVACEQGAELIVAMLGVLKAGAAYLPVDPDFPLRRIAFLAKDASVQVLVTGSEHVAAFAELAPTVVAVGADSSSATGPEASVATAGDAPAYVIYTSGSTGEPKGVVVPHRAVVRLVLDTDYVRFEPNDRVAQAAVPSFDAATFEIWGPLLSGAACVCCPKEVAIDAERLGPFLRERRVSVMWVTSSLFNQLADRDAAIFSGLRQVLVGGEPLDPAHIRRALERGPGRLQNGYGPTENTTFSCVHDIERVGEHDRSIPIGRPIAHSDAWVLDERGEPLPFGVPGELCLGGDGLALGYLGAPELTAERFVASPFDPGGRLFRTRDRARLRSDGTLEFLGRLDAQLKIRGHRIEPGEVQSCLLAQPGVREAAVIAHEQRSGDKRLVAYVVGGGIDLTGLGQRLRDQLPGFMVPDAFVELDALPLNANGKVDRLALPAPNFRDTKRAFVEPNGELETSIATIWKELLGLDHVGATDGFFELGGHSLLAMRAIGRLRDELAVELDLAGFLEEPTVAGIARRCAARTTSSSEVEEFEL